MVFLAAKVRLFLQNAYPDLDFVGSVDCHYSIYFLSGIPTGLFMPEQYVGTFRLASL